MAQEQGSLDQAGGGPVPSDRIRYMKGPKIRPSDRIEIRKEERERQT